MKKSSCIVFASYFCLRLHLQISAAFSIKITSSCSFTPASFPFSVLAVVGSLVAMCTPTLTSSSMMLSRTVMCSWTPHLHYSPRSTATVIVTHTAVLTNQVLKKWLFLFTIQEAKFILLLKAKRKVMLHPPLPHVTRPISMYIFMSS